MPQLFELRSRTHIYYLSMFLIFQDLKAFGNRVESLHQDLADSDVFSRDCGVANSWLSIEAFLHRLEPLESEAQDLTELQALLESNIVNFTLLPQ